ncbi:Protein CBG11374 [Caenorhabditis briggsae]|uniref:Protein CBG11374 n=1 Tax=Caenorhabditis briggsae TaxID=6238 RepID=A8XD61_CAEBR|nr:Protein CBG11374 [Caenorhabditis briggsae]CAP30580.1 Protein CBG11374 [Caenorhabditis briggsae]
MEITAKIFLHLIQFAGFLFGQITNATLLFLVLTRAEKLFGSYRNVMAAFASYSLGYTWIEVLAQPVMHIKGAMFIVMMDGPIKMEAWMGNLLGSLYCGSTALCISLLTAQFYYRYVALCKEVMAENYGVDLFNESFIGPMYYTYDENGARILRWVDIMASVGCSCMMGTGLSLIAFCIFNIYSKLKNAGITMSPKTKELNRQLFVTLSLQYAGFLFGQITNATLLFLVLTRAEKLFGSYRNVMAAFASYSLGNTWIEVLAQPTIVPLIMMYGPVGAFITLPFLEIEVGTLGNYVGASAGAYPAIEPLIAIYFIKDFRNAVLCRQKRTGAKLNYISNNSQTRNSDIFSNSFH